MEKEIEQIMMPYIEMKEKMENDPALSKNVSQDLNEKIAKLREDRLLEKKALMVRLERLRDNRDQEIAEYISQGIQDGSDFFAGYASTVRKDLEQVYNEKEEALERQIKELSKKTEEEILSMKQLNSLSTEPDYRKRVYIRNLVDVKNNLRKELFAKQKEINLALSRERINFDSSMLDLSQFKYEYDENHRPLNGNEWKALYEKGDAISSRINELKNSLKLIEKYLLETELTEEEIKVVMTAITPQEKAIIESNSIVEPEPTPVAEPENDSFTYEEEDVVYREDPVSKPEYEEKGNKIKVDNRTDLVKLIYNDIMDTIENTDTVTLHDSAKNLKDTERYVGVNNEIKGSVDLDNIALPNGEYVNSEDFNAALDKYVEKNKGRTYVVKDKKDKLRITNVNEFKKALNNSSILYFGKKIASKLGIKAKEQNSNSSVNIGEMDADVKSGIYVSRNELIKNINTLFETKKITWLKDLASKFKKKLEISSAPIKDDEENYEDIYSNSDIELNDDYVIKTK